MFCILCWYVILKTHHPDCVVVFWLAHAYFGHKVQLFTMLSHQFIILFLMYWHAEKLKRRAKTLMKHSRYRKTFFNSLNDYQRPIRRRYIPGPSLHLPSMFAWRTLYASKQDQALITLTNVDFVAFDWLAEKFAVSSSLLPILDLRRSWWRRPYCCQEKKKYFVVRAKDMWFQTTQRKKDLHC